MNDETQEQVTDEAAAQATAQAEKEAAKAAEKAAKEAAKAEAKAKREAEAAERKAQREAAKEAAKAEREAVREAKKAEREAAKAAAVAAREANRMPEQNGIRRPKPATLCGQAWAIFDSVSQQNGSPASIGESLQVARDQSLNEGNVRAEYARWRKFHGITGRIAAPAAEVAEATPEAAA